MNKDDPEAWKKKLYFSLPIVIDYIDSFRCLCRKEKGHYQILNGKEVVKSCTRLCTKQFSSVFHGRTITVFINVNSMPH